MFSLCIPLFRKSNLLNLLIFFYMENAEDRVNHEVLLANKKILPG